MPPPRAPVQLRGPNPGKPASTIQPQSEAERQARVAELLRWIEMFDSAVAAGVDYDDAAVAADNRSPTVIRDRLREEIEELQATVEQLTGQAEKQRLIVRELRDAVYVRIPLETAMAQIDVMGGHSFHVPTESSHIEVVVTPAEIYQVALQLAGPKLDEARREILMEWSQRANIRGHNLVQPVLVMHNLWETGG